MDYFDVDSEELLTPILYDENGEIEYNKADQPSSFQVPAFVCNNDTSRGFHEHSFIRSRDLQSFNKLTANDQLDSKRRRCDIRLFSDEYDSRDLTEVSELLDMFFKEARFRISCFHHGSDSEYEIKTSFPELRKSVTQFLYALRENIMDIDPEVNLIAELLLVVQRIGGFVIPRGVIDSDFNFHYRHGQLDWRWLCLTTYFKYNATANSTSIIAHGGEDSYFGKLLRYIMFDLLMVALYQFNITAIEDIVNCKPYPCSCYSELWLLIQLMLEKNDLNFWGMFKECLVINIEKEVNIYVDNDPVLARNFDTSLNCQNYHIFVLWIMSDVAELQCFNELGEYVGDTNYRIIENYEFLEQHTIDFLSVDRDEEKMRIYECLVMKFLKMWPPKPTIVTKFWDYFHKKINSPFYIGGRIMSAMSVTVNTGHSFLEKIKKNVAVMDTPSPNKTSFTIFVDMMGYLIRVYRMLSQTNQITKLMGRIYLKLAPSKLISLNEVGINNVGQLLLTLAITSDIRETGTKMCDILLNIALDKVGENLLAVITKVHMAAMLILLENSINVESYVQKFLTQLKNLMRIDKEESSKRSVIAMKIVVQDFEYIFLGNETLELGESKLFDSWITNYLDEIYPSELDRFFGMMIKILQRINKNESPNVLQLKSNIFKYLLPYMKQNATTINYLNNYMELTTVLCLTVSNDGDTGLPRFRDTFQFFIQVDHSARIDQFIRFWLNIIESDKIQTIDTKLILKNWIKCCLFSKERSPNLDTFTKYVIDLPNFHELYKSDEIDQMVNSKFPHHTFFEGVGHKYQNLTDHNARYKISEAIFYLLSDFDKWTKAYYTQSRENTIRVYKTIGKIFLYCAPVCYIRTKSDCFLNVAITTFILPYPILVGKIPEPNVVQSVHLIWPLIIEGFSKLDYKSDPQVKQYLMELVLKWTPHFRMISTKPELSAKPYIVIANGCNDQIVDVIYEHVVMNFIKLKTNQTHPQACLAISIFHEIFKNIQDKMDKLKLLLNKTALEMMEHALKADNLMPSKRMIFDYFDGIFKCPIFRGSSDLREIIITTLKIVTKNNLSFYSAYYFQFLTTIGKSNPAIVKEMIGFIQIEIGSIEEIRGGKKDPLLRNALQAFERAVQ